MGGKTWTGRAAANARAYVIERDAGVCALCTHPGANSLDHIEPVDERPDLEWTPSNWQAAHLRRAGKPDGCTYPGCTCVGNYGKGGGSNDDAVRRSRRGTDAAPSRDW